MTRVKAAQACIDRFNGKTYEPGKRDCWRLFLHLLHQLGRSVPAARRVRYSTETGAYRALRKAGFECLADAVDSLGFERIPPARAMAGDLVAVPSGEDAFGCALTVAVGNGRVFGFLNGRGQVVEPKAFVAAWRL